LHSKLFTHPFLLTLDPCLLPALRLTSGMHSLCRLITLTRTSCLYYL
jgi:hypothetical protein